MVFVVRVKSPVATVTTYDDAGSDRFQLVVVSPSCSVWSVITPLAMPIHGDGTVTLMS